MISQLLHIEIIQYNVVYIYISVHYYNTNVLLSVCVCNGVLVWYSMNLLTYLGR